MRFPVIAPEVSGQAGMTCKSVHVFSPPDKTGSNHSPTHHSPLIYLNKFIRSNVVLSRVREDT